MFAYSQDSKDRSRTTSRLSELRPGCFTLSTLHFILQYVRITIPESTQRLAAMQGCQITGSLHISRTELQETECVNSAGMGHDNTLVAPSAPVYWPAEEGPFVYMPDPLRAH